MSTPQQIQAAVLGSNTTLYTAFTGTVPLPTRAMLVSLDLTNTTTADITVDCFWVNAAGSTSRYFMKTVTVPALGSISWRGLITLAVAAETIKAIASTTGIDALGTVIENA